MNKTRTRLIAFGLPSYFLMKQQKELKQELARRNPTQAQQEDLDEELAQRRRRSLITLLVIIVVGVAIFLAILLPGLNTGGSRSYGFDDGCRFCGRDTSLIAGFDCCSDCYYDVIANN